MTEGNRTGCTGCLVTWGLLGAIFLLPLALLPFAMRPELILFAPGAWIFVWLFCLPVAFWYLVLSGDSPTSRPFRLRRTAWIAGGAFLSIALGQVLIATRNREILLPFFVLAAALPPLVALSLASRYLGPVTTWRRVTAALLCGALISTSLTLLLGTPVDLLAYEFISPLRDLVARVVASRSLEDLFYSRGLLAVMIPLAVTAPLVEELTKPLLAAILARRLRGPAEAFLLGMASGVGFAILENMLYESAGVRVWAHIAALRGVGGVLHPLNAGLVALGWYGVRNGLPGAWRRWFAYYGLAVGAHALWNGGLVILYSDIGARFLTTTTWQLSIYGSDFPGMVMVFMLLEAVALWRILLLVVERLRDPGQPEVERLLPLRLEQPRQLALWASIAALSVVPIAYCYGPLLARYLEVVVPVR